MHIGGFIKQSLIDYPGKIASIVFTAGCNLRCPYCHNSDLVLINDKTQNIDENEILKYLKENASLLDGVVITGGEPLMHHDIFDFIRKIRGLGLLVKIDTNGSFPEVLKKIIDEKAADYIAMDVKNYLKFSQYQKASGKMSQQVFEKILKSISILIDSGIDHEFRTTIVKGIHRMEDLAGLARSLAKSKSWVLQNFNEGNILDRTATFKPFGKSEMDQIERQTRLVMKNVYIR
jgi:pyruvate formate lyase activating enzyme